MKKSATPISTYWHGIISRCRSNVRNFLTMLFLLSGMLFVTQKSASQNQPVDFRQGANRDAFKVQNVSYVTGEIHWINSILQQSNSRYIEGMSTIQRVVFTDLPTCNSGNHVLRVKMQTRKSTQHAYDFMTSWDNAFKAAAQIAPGFNLMPSSRADVAKLHECGPGISSDAEDGCDLVTGGGVFRDIPIIFGNYADPAGPGESNLLIEGPPADQNTTRQVIQTYECRYGDNVGTPTGTFDRSVRVYAEGGFQGVNGDANNQVVFAGYGDSAPGTGDSSYIFYDIKWSSLSSTIVIEFAAHIAVGVDGLAATNPDLCNVTSLGVGYLLSHGASSISGGPYHVILENFRDAPGNTPHCEGNLGNQDNQLQGSEILLIPDCDLTGPTAVCGNSTATYTATVTNPDNAGTEANNSTYLWEIINSSQNPPPNPAAATINPPASGIVPQVPAGQTSVPLSITVNTGGVGTYTVKLTITNGAATQTADDNISSSCTFITTVSGGPNIVCPTSTAVAPCQSQSAINTAYQAWLVSATGGGTITHNGGSVGPSPCGGTNTVIFTATNSCGTATCSATFTVNPDITPPTLTPTGGSCTLACNPSAEAISGCLGSATATDACGTPTVTSSDGNVTSDGCSRSQIRTFTARDACGNTSTASRTATWTADQTPPTITCANNKTIECGTPIVFDNPTATDNCDASPAIETLSTSGDGLTRTWIATDDCGNTATCSQTITIGDCVENIFPTGTTCEQFQAQNTPTTESLCFSQNNGIVANASAPGAWFYYTYVVKPAGVSSISVRINQTNDGVIAGLFTSDEIKAWTAGCEQITRRVTRDYSDPAHPVITIEFVGGAVNSALTLVISAKYNSQSIVGSAVTGTSSVYSFSSSRRLGNAAFSVIPNSEESITANECNANLLTVAGPLSELVTDQPANQLRVSAYPNPFTHVVRFTINSNISGQAQLEVVNMAGQRIAVVYNGHIEANRNRVVEYKISASVQQTLIYVLRMGGKQVTGKLIKLE